MARAARIPPEPAPRVRDGGSAALRGREREAVRPGRGDHRAAAAPRAAAERSRSTGGTPASPGPREGGEGGLPLREPRDTGGARRVGRGRARSSSSATDSPCAPDAGRGARRGRRRRPSSVWHSQPAFIDRLRYPLDYGSIVRTHARNYDLDPAMLAAVIYAESRFDPDARSAAGALGLMQLLPDTARGIAVRTGGHGFVTDDLFEPEINVRYGAWYLRNLLQKYDDERLAARGLPRRPGERRRLDRQGCRHPVPRDPRVRRARPRARGRCTATPTRRSSGSGEPRAQTVVGGAGTSASMRRQTFASRVRIGSKVTVLQKSRAPAEKTRAPASVS